MQLTHRVACKIEIKILQFLVVLVVLLDDSNDSVFIGLFILFIFFISRI